MNEMASSSSTATPRVTKRRREEDSPSQEKYSFTGKRLTSQSKRIVMNVVEYFTNEAKKSKGHSNVVERAHRATGKA